MKRHWLLNLSLALILLGMVLGASIALRFPFLGNAGTWWRAQHTMLTTFWLIKNGLGTLLQYETPLHGTPFRAPYEFPLVQAITALLVRGFHWDLSLTSQLVSFFFYLLGAVCLWGLALRFLSIEQTFFSLAAYLFYPYMVYWSVSPLIDYPALTLGLMYLWFLDIGFNRPSKFWLFCSVLCGTLGYLVKPQTMPIFLPAAFWMVFRSLPKPGTSLDSEKWRDYLRQLINPEALKSFLLYLAFPAVIGLMWIIYGDMTKGQSLIANRFQIFAMRSWFFGENGAFISVLDKAKLLRAVEMIFFPGVFLILPVAFLAGLKDLPSKSQSFLLTMIAGMVLTLVLFSNLYLVHGYYFIACSVTVALVLGVGLEVLINKLFERRNWLFILFWVLLIGNSMQVYSFWRETDQNLKMVAEPRELWSAQVRALIPEDEYVISVQGDWYPAIIFYLERKGLIVTPLEAEMDICAEILKEPKYTFIVNPADDPQPETLEKVLGCFDHQVIEEMTGVYRVVPLK